MDSLEELCDEAAGVWPDVDWGGSSLARGAFHDVLIASVGIVARISRSGFAASAMESRIALLRSLPNRLGALSVPRVIDGVRQWSDTRSGALIEFIPGEARSQGDVIPAAALAEVLTAVRSITPSLVRREALREWCGGEQFPALVSDVLTPRLPDDLAAQAMDAVESLLDCERGGAGAVVHGDLTPFNIRWSGDVPVGLIDWDFAAIGDPALDIAGILTTLGRATASQLCDPPTLERASMHRATFPLQIACAGFLHDDQRLLSTGVKNFIERARSQTLHWPRD